MCRPRGIRERDDSLLANSRQAAPGFFARTSVDEDRNGANYTLLNLNHSVTGTAWLKIARYVYAAEKYGTRVAIENHLSYRESLAFFPAFSSSVGSSRVSFLHHSWILQILRDERSAGTFLIHSFHSVDFLTRLFVYLSRINNFLLVNHHDVPLETQFSSLSPTVNLLEGALDNLFLSLHLSLFLSSNNLSSERREERRIATTTRTKKKDAKMRKREPATCSLYE